MSAPASAQACGGFGHLVTTGWWGSDPYPPGWFYYGPYPGTYQVEIATWGAPCPPMAWCPKCGAWVPISGAPINLTSGNTYIEENDVRLPGLGGGLRLGRTWNSIFPPILQGPPQTGMFGLNWRSTYEERIFTGSGDSVNYMVYAQADGSVSYFSQQNSSTWIVASPATLTATLTQNGTTSWTLAFQNGEQRVFDYTTGWLTKIIDRNGNTTQLTYDGSRRLTTVTDPASRHLTFTYNGSSALASSVSSDVGSLTLSYSYDTQNRLIQVTEPDLTTLSFTYNSQSLITTVTDSQGKTLESHTYDSYGRGLTSSKANGVEAVTVSYQ